MAALEDVQSERAKRRRCQHKLILRMAPACFDIPIEQTGTARGLTMDNESGWR